MNGKKFCPQCLKEGKKSTITEGATSSTLVYVPRQWDENGNYKHSRDVNTTKTSYTCSNGHHWVEET